MFENRYRILNSFLIIILLLGLLSCNQTKKKQNEFIYGVKIYNIDKDIDSLLNEWIDLGFNSAFVSDKIAQNKAFMQKAKESKIFVFIIEPIFYNPDALTKDSSLFAITNKGNIAKSDWLEMACPSNQKYFRRVKEKLINDVTNYNPNGLSLDFIRNFVYWEMVKPNQESKDIEHGCFCKTCVANFCESSQLELNENFSNSTNLSSFILSNYKHEWTAWKTLLINNRVEEIKTEIRRIKPDIKFNLHALPWREKDYNGGIHFIAGQDFSTLSRTVDYISPMCYAFMLERDGDWISSVVEDLNRQANGKILPSIQVKESYKHDKLKDHTFENYLNYALRPPSIGVVFWSWEHLEKDPSKKEIIRNILIKKKI